MTEVDDRTMRERMLAGDPYIADDPDIFRESNWARQMTHRINTLDPADTAEADRLFRETDISMGGCMNCHRANRASLDCTFCHEQRN